MKTYLIGDSSTEKIEFKVFDDKYALVHKSTSSLWEVKAIILNQREALHFTRQGIREDYASQDKGGKLMPELTDIDAIRMAIDYYEKQRGFRFTDAVKITALLAKADAVGLIQYAFNQGVISERAKK